MSEERATLVSKALALSYGLLCLAMAYLTHLMGDSVLLGALVGLGAGLAVSFWVGVGSIITRSSGAKSLPPSCCANTTTAFQTVLSNVTRSDTNVY